MIPGQLIFDLPTQENFNPQNFFVSSSNSKAAKLIHLFPKWHNNGIVISGPEKSGKTHISHIWKSIANANFYDLKSELVFDTINSNNNCIFDNFDFLNENDERKFFQIYNDIINNKNYLLILIKETSLNIKLKDLKSRIDALNLATINDPDDLLIQAIILKFFHDKQINVAPDVINFILKRINRNFTEISLFLSNLNDLSIKHKSKISIPFLNRFFAF